MTNHATVIVAKREVVDWRMVQEGGGAREIAPSPYSKLSLRNRQGARAVTG